LSDHASPEQGSGLEIGHRGGTQDFATGEIAERFQYDVATPKEFNPLWQHQHFQGLIRYIHWFLAVV
jgi:hypothetical protein